MLGSRRTAAVLLGLLLALPLAAEEPAPAPLGEKDAVAFAQRLQADLLAGRFADFDAAFDLDAMGRAVMDKYEAPPGFRTGFLKGFKSHFGMGKQIASQLGAVTGYKFLRVRKEGERFRAVFRLVVATGGLNYHEYVLAQVEGKPRIEDLYVYSTGELFTETLGRIALPGLLAERKRDDGLAAADQEALDGLKALQRYTEALHGDHPEDAEALHEALPESLKSTKAVMLLRLGSLETGDPAAFQKALDAFAKTYPADPSLDLFSLDANLGAKKWQPALECIGRLDQRAGGDPYLDFLRANVYLLSEKYDLARAAAEKAMDAEPALQDAYLSWITATLKERKFEDTAKGLERFEKQFGRIEADLTKEIEYAPFLASDPGKAWWKAHEAAAGPKPASPEPDAPKPDAPKP